MKLRKTAITGLAATAAFALTGVATATPSTGSESQTLPFLYPLSPAEDKVLTFDLFDDMGGTRELQMVEVFMNVTIGADVTATNTSEIPAQTFSVSLSGNAQVSFGGVTATSLLGVTESVPPEDLPIAPGDTWDFGHISDSDSSSGSTTMNLANFVGVGTIDAIFNATGGFSVSGAADSQLNVNNFETSGDVTIIYHYKLITPAPGALALLGLAGLVGTRRRR